MKGNGIRRIACFVLLAAALTGCHKAEDTQPAQESAAVENLRVIMMGNEPEEGMEELYEALDALTVPDLNCRVRFTFVPWGNERKQLNIAVASGEYDIIPGGVFSDYQIQISRNAFLNLNDYLYLVPELVEHYNYYSEDYLKQCEVDGGLYGIPQFDQGVCSMTTRDSFIGKTCVRNGAVLRLSVWKRWRRICMQPSRIRSIRMRR